MPDKHDPNRGPRVAELMRRRAGFWWADYGWTVPAAHLRAGHDSVGPPFFSRSPEWRHTYRIRKAAPERSRRQHGDGQSVGVAPPPSSPWGQQMLAAGAFTRPPAAA